MNNPHPKQYTVKNPLLRYAPVVGCPVCGGNHWSLQVERLTPHADIVAHDAGKGITRTWRSYVFECTDCGFAYDWVIETEVIPELSNK